MKFLFIFSVIILNLFFLPRVVYAGCTPGGFAGTCPAGVQAIENIFGNIITLSVGMGFMATLVMIIYSGIKYITSGGEQKALQSAHQTATWAILGIIFLAIAWITLLLIQAFTGVHVTTFDIKKLF